MSDTTDSTAKVYAAIESHRLHDAFVELRHNAARLSDWRLTDEIDRLEESYRMMLRYAVDGASDPQRPQLYASISSGILRLADLIDHRMHLAAAPQIFYSVLRYERMQQADTTASLLDEYLAEISRTSLYDMISSPSAEAKASRTKLEALEKRLFNRVWTSFPIESDEASLLRRHLTSPSALPTHMADLLTSALTLSLVSYYDEAKLLLLLDIYAAPSTTQRVAIRALCGALLAMFIYRRRDPGKRVADRVALLRDTAASWTADVRTVMMEFVRSRQTESINRKLTDELLPDMIKLRPDIARRLNEMGAAPLDPESLEANPEWEELLDKSGIADKIKELMKLQEDGGDVFMATFSNLKQFPFFSDVANWFTPFRTDHPALSLSDSDGKTSAIGQLLESMEMLCDGDKYSVMLMMETVPAPQRRMMLSQLDEQQMAALEMHAATTDTTTLSRRSTAARYVQTLYRFFKLFRRRGDFRDPFARPINLIDVPLLQSDLSEPETLDLVAEFYFRRHFWDDALAVYRRMADILPPDEQRLQKTGACLQHTGRYDEALEALLHAELLNAESAWTLRRIAACYRATGRTAEALGYYTRALQAMRRDDLSLELSIGHCLMELDRPGEAIKHYFKVEYLDGDKSTRSWRPIAWCSLVMGDYRTARTYYDRILTDNPTAADYLNMGNLHLATGNVREAVNFYSLSIDSRPDADTEGFIADFIADLPTLTASGRIDPQLPQLIIDALLYRRR